MYLDELLQIMAGAFKVRRPCAISLLPAACQLYKAAAAQMSLYDR